MSNKKQNILIVLGLIVLIALIGAVSYAFFNYTRTGSANIVRTGNITFNSDYESINISNVFPIDKANVLTDTTNVMTVNVNIEGSTTYEKGLYYEVKAQDVNLTVNGKNVPIGISVTSSNLDNVTLTSYEDGKILTNNSLFAEGRILKSDSNNDNSVDGTITIKAYLDRSKIAITDTIEDGNIIVTGYNNGTTNGWINGRVVLTTEEWNSLASTPLSFKVRVEAIENDVATLVDGQTFIGKVKKLANPNLDDSTSTWKTATIDNNITTFQRMFEKPDISGFDEGNVISTEDSSYPIYAWYENGVIKYYSESDNIKANKDMTSMFYNLKSLENIGDLANLDTTNVTDMDGVFYYTGITSLELLSNWNVSNVANMAGMFCGCTGITSLNGLSNWNVSNVTDMQSMFAGCTGLTSLNDLSNWNVSNVTNMRQMFYNCTGLTSLDGLSKWNVSNVTQMRQMFCGCTALVDTSEINDWYITNVITGPNGFGGMFAYAPSHPTFTKRAGTWNNGTFIPAA